MIRLTETDSTSNHLSRLADTCLPEEFTVVSADYQTAGKGQRGNSWEAEAGKNLLFSFILYPGFLVVRKQFLLSKLISLSIKEALEAYATGFSIKWPNDIYYNDLKICGILLENQLTGTRIERCIAGVGINVNQQTFHSPAPNPVSLFNICGSEQDRTALLDNILQKVSHYYQLLQAGEEALIDRLYAASLYRKEGFHPYTDANGAFSARIVEVLPEGLLILEDSEGKQRSYAFKEVQFRG